ncbi:alpha-L-fucosidase [Portibacter lacus]|uniref:alpha-L-fucosidase n=1 Tax=Portibacter lacus TaxID=1099794 RepID=A0AA37SM72_9BACT|nr:alpha-L-fucosidase [Portibacter lacus]GLR15639.1 alpha-L-fucosidase [Portibacter lacus]
MKFKYIFLLAFLVGIQASIISQAIYEDERYVPETDPLVLEKLDEWQDIKFGLLMHWGTYSQWGIVESWSLCPEEYGWCERKMGSNPDDYNTYKAEYEGLQKTFNPTKFNPDQWAKAANNAGMKYVIFTTKHHDGFCMFDSKYTDYKITSDDCPFATNPRSNVTKEIFEAFRKKDMWTGAYFSKPDWNVESYWDPKYPPKDRNVNYEPEANPERWQEYVDFTQNQMLELLTDYGKVDILWLDGGWVSKKPKSVLTSWYDDQLKNSESGYIKTREINQDIKIDEFVKKARAKQPGLLVVDRAVHGKNQNYLTPENRIPEKALPYPWESCIISGGGWSHTKNAKYMSGREGVQTLVDIVAKGGNLLLNIAPTPEGEWQQGAYDLLAEFGKWMDVNSEGIYESNTLAPFKEKNICMTQKENGNTYFFYMAEEDEKNMPSKISVESHQPAAGSEVTLLGYDQPLKWMKEKAGFSVEIPTTLQENPPADYVWTIKVSALK